MNGKATVRYYLLVLVILSFFFFSNDFGLTDVQKTALVIAVGIDKEEDNFIVTTQIAVPKSKDSGENSASAEIVSKGKTVAAAFEKLNQKTGWYPKLVFCDLIVLGEEATKVNVMQSLGGFIRNEYLSDSCQLAVCDGKAQDILTAKVPTEALSGLAAVKVLSDHAKRVGNVLPNTLREFAITYFGESGSGLLPVLSLQKTTEDTPAPPNSGGSSSQQGGQSSGQSGQSGQGGQSQASGQKQQEQVFSASETAVFTKGVRVGKLTAKETKGVAFALNKLRLATSSIGAQDQIYSLLVKRSTGKINLNFKEDTPTLEIKIDATAGLNATSKAEELRHLADPAEMPEGLLPTAAETLKNELLAVFYKTKEWNADVFGCLQELKRKEFKRYEEEKDSILQKIEPKISVTFKNVR